MSAATIEIRIPTPEDEHRVLWTHRLAMRADRLYRLCKVNAPAVLIEKERRLVLQAMAEIPAAPADVARERRCIDEVALQRETHLGCTGFYDDAAHALKDAEGGASA